MAKRGVTLALGGGGARGFAHVGVMAVLYQGDIRVESIVGSSAGAIAGAGLALGYSPGQMRQRIKEFAESPLANDPKFRAIALNEACQDGLTITDRMGRLFCQGRVVKSFLLSASIMTGDFFQGMVEFFLPDVPIESMQIPFSAVATDIKTGKAVVFDRGSLYEAVVASCSVPGVAPPVQVNGLSLTDGGVVSLVPADVARQQGAKRILAVSVERDILCEQEPHSALELYLRAGDIQGNLLNQLQLSHADLVVHPAVGSVHWVDFLRHEWIIDQGAAAARACWGQIQQLAGRRVWPWSRRRPVRHCTEA